MVIKFFRELLEVDSRKELTWVIVVGEDISKEHRIFLVNAFVFYGNSETIYELYWLGAT